MSVNTQEVRDLLEAKFNATGRAQSFDRWFSYALQRVLDDLGSDKVGVTIEMPADLSEDLDCDAYYMGVLVDGIIRYFENSGFWGQDDNDRDLILAYEQSLRRAHTHYAGTQTIYTLGGGPTTAVEE